MTNVCVWCGKTEKEHGEPGVSRMGGPNDRLCPVSGVTSQFYTPRLSTNDLWQEVPDSIGIWWAVNPRSSFEHQYLIATVFHEPGRMDSGLRVWIAVERIDYPPDHWRGYLLWQKAIPPIFSWPEPDLDP